MRIISAAVWMSLDGVMESPEQWAFPYANDEVEEVNHAGMAASDTLLLGRVTYQEFAAYWPNQSSDVPIAAYINTVPKVVVSTTLHTVAWRNSTLIRTNVAEELTRLKQQQGKHITIIGSAALVQSLLRDGLIDELRLLVPPVVLGGGKRLFSATDMQQALTLVNARTFSTGVVYLIYRPDKHGA